LGFDLPFGESSHKGQAWALAAKSKSPAAAKEVFLKAEAIETMELEFENAIYHEMI
jgi:hypothetical protein